MTPFRERNPVAVGAVSLVLLALLVVAALRADDLPVIGGGDSYHAMFTEAGGLAVDDEVRIAGVRVGRVDEIALDGDRVRVTFTVDDGADLGADTGAAIKVKTILGSMFLALEPAGGGRLDEGATIPAARTSSPSVVTWSTAGPTTPTLGTASPASATLGAMPMATAACARIRRSSGTAARISTSVAAAGSPRSAAASSTTGAPASAIVTS